jgi:hypothetical protein
MDSMVKYMSECLDVVSVANKFWESLLRLTNTCSLFAGSWESGVDGKGLSMGNGSVCLYDVEAETGVVIARKESNSFAVTLPAEWHCRDGCRCIGILKTVV